MLWLKLLYIATKHGAYTHLPLCLHVHAVRPLLEYMQIYHDLKKINSSSKTFKMIGKIFVDKKVSVHISCLAIKWTLDSTCCGLKTLIP